MIGFASWRASRRTFLLGLGAAVALGVTLDRRRRWLARRTFSVPSPDTSRWALVTGASSGIGRAYAVALAGLGYHVILVGRRWERLEAVAAQISEAYPVDTIALCADLTTPGGIEAVEEIIRATDGLSFLVNNAGFGLPGAFATVDFERVLDMVQLHILATMRLTRAALPGMLARRHGAIVNVSSLMAYYPLPEQATYAATKCYQRAFTEALHQELMGSGVRAQALCPGFVRTEFQASAGIQRQLPDFLWLAPEFVVQHSLRHLAEDQVLSVPGIGYRMLAGLAGVIPRSLFYLIGNRFGMSKGCDGSPVG